MSRKFKTLGVAVIAVFAMSAVIASAAQAKFDTLKTGTATAILSAESTENQVFTANGVPVSCTKVVLGGPGSTNTIKNNSTEATVHPEYSGCSIPGLGSATVKTEGCHYLFTSETNASNLAQVHIICEGSGIQIVGPLGCTITVPSQTVTGVTYTNGTGNVTITPNVSGIHYTSTAVCSLVGIEKEGVNATYKGKVKVTANNDVEGNPGAATTIQYETLTTSTMP